MLCVSFAMTEGAYEDRAKTETRRFWKAGHARKFRPGTVFMGITKDFRAGGVRMHAARVVFCKQERLGEMSEESFLREGGTRYWRDRAGYVAAMGGPTLVPFVLRFDHLEGDGTLRAEDGRTLRVWLKQWDGNQGERPVCVAEGEHRGCVMYPPPWMVVPDVREEKPEGRNLRGET